VVLPGKDEQHQRHARAIAASCRKRGIRAAVLRLDGGLSYWLDAGGTPDRLLELAEAALKARRSLLPPGPTLAPRSCCWTTG
jgi:hypothetical protein